MGEPEIFEEFGNKPVFNLSVHVDDEVVAKMRRNLAFYAWLKGFSDQQVQAIAGDGVHFGPSPGDLPTGRPVDISGGDTKDQVGAMSEGDLIAEAFKEVYLEAFRAECARRLGLDVEFEGVEAWRGSVNLKAGVRARPRRTGKIKTIAGLTVAFLNAMVGGADAVSKYPEIKENIPVMVADVQRVAGDTLQTVIRMTAETDTSVKGTFRAIMQKAAGGDISIGKDLRGLLQGGRIEQQEGRFRGEVTCKLSDEVSLAIQNLEREIAARAALENLSQKNQGEAKEPGAQSVLDELTAGRTESEQQGGRQAAAGRGAASQ